MPRYEVTPWRTRDELIRVREQLYGAINSGVDEERDERRKAVSTVRNPFFFCLGRKECYI